MEKKGKEEVREGKGKGKRKGKKEENEIGRGRKSEGANKGPEYPLISLSLPSFGYG